MNKKYEAPELEITYFEIKNRIMEDDDSIKNPWEDWLEDESAGDADTASLEFANI